MAIRWKQPKNCPAPAT